MTASVYRDRIPCRSLDLHDNDLDGKLPTSLSLLSSLRYLHLCCNSISGSIPPSILSALSGLYQMDLSRNALNGSLPSTIGRLTLLK